MIHELHIYSTFQISPQSNYVSIVCLVTSSFVVRVADILQYKLAMTWGKWKM